MITKQFLIKCLLYVNVTNLLKILITFLIFEEFFFKLSDFRLQIIPMRKYFGNIPSNSGDNTG